MKIFILPHVLSFTIRISSKKLFFWIFAPKVYGYLNELFSRLYRYNTLLTYKNDTYMQELHTEHIYQSHKTIWSWFILVNNLILLV